MPGQFGPEGMFPFRPGGLHGGPGGFGSDGMKGVKREDDEESIPDQGSSGSFDASSSDGSLNHGNQARGKYFGISTNKSMIHVWDNGNNES